MPPHAPPPVQPGAVMAVIDMGGGVHQASVAKEKRIMCQFLLLFDPCHMRILLSV
jgi:hypothetical protein